MRFLARVFGWHDYDPLPMSTPNIQPGLRTYRRHVYIAAGMLLVTVWALMLYRSGTMVEELKEVPLKHPAVVGAHQLPAVELPARQGQQKLRMPIRASATEEAVYSVADPEERIPAETIDNDFGVVSRVPFNGTILILEGNYTPENFADAPHHFVIAVANAKPEDLIKYKASHPYREILSYRLKPGRDFFEVFINETAHLMPISVYKKEGDVFYPVDATFHNRLWRNSKKLECLMGHPDMKGVEPKLLPKDLEWLAAFRDLCFEQAVIPFLAKRTLLGWRRQCALLPAAGGFDLNVFDEEFPDALIADEAKLATRRLRVEHTFGKRRSGTYEVHLTSMEPAARPFEILLNPMYNGNDGYNFETMITGEGDDAVLWDLEYPWFVKNFCTAALHGHIFHVPCDPYQLILANYGPNWDDIDDYKLKNARKLGPLNDRKWQRPNV